MGIAHAVSHVSDSRHGVPQLVEQDLSVSKVLALDQSCEQCLAFVQIASAVDTPYHSFPAASHAVPVSTFADTPAACQRTVCTFQPRAPPPQLA